MTSTKLKKMIIWWVTTVLLAVVRLAWTITNNLYAIPAHLIVMTTLLPLRMHFPNFYNYIDGVSFRWIQFFIGHWLFSAGYKIAECGDDISALEDEPVLMLVNHQSTSDVPSMMYILQFHNRVLDRVMWVMDILFKYTNFGWISQMRGDFFIQQGKETRSLQGPLLQKHIKKYYIPRDRQWIIVFPEGGFFYKQKTSSQAYAKKNNLPHLEHCVLPRAGAVHAILQVLAPQAQPDDNPLDQQRTLKWLVDATIAYPNGKPLDLLTIMLGCRDPMMTIIHYRKYPVSEVPIDQGELLQWLYERYTEKDQMLAEFYKTGKFPAQGGNARASAEPHILNFTLTRCYGLHLFYIMLTCCIVYIIREIYNSISWAILSVNL